MTVNVQAAPSSKRSQTPVVALGMLVALAIIAVFGGLLFLAS